MLLQYDRRSNLPTAQDLPDSDETPVDNELQDLIPHILKSTLALIWADRMDWFFGVDMGIYYHPDEPAIIPDGFLSVGVPRFIDENLRLSYVLWEEKKVPILVLEVVSHNRRGEYTTKKEDYQQLGILYYVIYNPLRNWRAEIVSFRTQLRKYLTTNLQNYLAYELPIIYQDALAYVQEKTAFSLDLPQECPYTLEQLLEQNRFKSED